MRILCISIVLSSLFTTVKGQVFDTIPLPQVIINDSRTSIFTVGSFVTEIDSSVLKNSTHQNLGDILSSVSSVFIKTYGSGGSATISSRGTEARHSAILWNGFNINSSSLGLTDLSLIPVSITGNIKLIHGGSSPVNGNSAIGSVISLEQSDPSFENQTQLYSIIEGGSFGNKHITAGAVFGSRHLVSNTVLFANSAKNNFEYTNIAKREQPVETQQHSAYENYGLSQNFYYKINPNQQLSAAVWYEVNHREIPPLMTVPESLAEQRDSILRTYIGYKINFRKSIVNVKAGYFREHQFYVDPEHKLDLRYDVINYLLDAELRMVISEKLIISNGIAYTNSQAEIAEYSGDQSRYLASVFSNTFYEPFRGWKINAGIRKEFASSENPPISPSIGLEGNLYRRIILLTANTGLHYNLPSMNDLYWVPGGNPNLKPEEAWNSEAGISFFKNHTTMPGLAITFYRSIVDNWIKWQPGAGGIYSPDNLRQVKASGIESSFNYRKKVKSFIVSIKVNYSFTKSVLTKSSDPQSEEIIGKQLIYIPENIANGILQLQYKNLSLQYNHTYTGERYTTSDNTRKLESYQLADVILNNTFKIKRHALDVFFKVMNIYNTSYQVLAYRPAPGRWYSCGIKMNLNLNLY